MPRVSVIGDGRLKERVLDDGLPIPIPSRSIAACTLLLPHPIPSTPPSPSLPSPPYPSRARARAEEGEPFAVILFDDINRLLLWSLTWSACCTVILGPLPRWFVSHRDCSLHAVKHDPRRQLGHDVRVVLRNVGGFRRICSQVVEHHSALD